MPPASRHPESVSHVVMIGVGPDLSDERRPESEKYWERLASAGRKAASDRNWEGVPEQESPESYPGESVVKTYARNGPLAWYDYEFDSTPLWKGIEINMDMFDHVSGTLVAEIDITKSLEALDRPVFLALGKYDFLAAPPSSWDRVKPAFKDLTIRIFGENGHTPRYEQADLFDSELPGWMQESASN